MEVLYPDPLTAVEVPFSVATAFLYEPERATRYFAKAAVRPVEGKMFMHNQDLHFCSRQRRAKHPQLSAFLSIDLKQRAGETTARKNAIEPVCWCGCTAIQPHREVSECG